MRVAPLALVLVLSGCLGDLGGGVDPGDPGDGTGGDDGPDEGPGPGDPVLFYEHVAPIFKRHCWSCHDDGLIAPFSLVTYDSAAARTADIAAAVSTRAMPPWGVDNSGDCQTYADARWLSEAEIATIVAWAEGGARAGSLTAAPHPDPPPPALERVDVTVDMGDAYTPQLRDDYRCFVLDAPSAPIDAYLTAFAVRPGVPQMVHHIVLYVLDDLGLSGATLKDNESPGLGYTCFGGAEVNGATVMGVWAPGVPVVRYPAGTGIPVPANSRFLMQVHYNTALGAVPDRTRVDLMGAATVEEPASLAAVLDPTLSLGPGQPEVMVSFDTPLSGLTSPISVHGLMPHMHLLGTRMRIELLHADGGTECIMDVPRWDFRWQQLYFYETPLVLQPTDILRVTCEFDTRGRTGTTTFGEGTEDEMCALIGYDVVN